MGRSVSYLSNASAIFYFDGSSFGMDEDGNYCEYKGRMDREGFVANIKYTLMGRYKSLDKCERWDDETKIFLENEIAEFGISEYCGCISLSVRAKEDDYGYTDRAENWISLIESNVQKLLIENFGNMCMFKVGTMSNGVSLFQK